MIRHGWDLNPDIRKETGLAILHHNFQLEIMSAQYQVMRPWHYKYPEKEVYKYYAY